MRVVIETQLTQKLTEKVWKVSQQISGTEGRLAIGHTASQFLDWIPDSEISEKQAMAVRNLMHTIRRISLVRQTQ